jgi:hypothetical protein
MSKHSKTAAVPREREWLNGAERARLKKLVDFVERGLRVPAQIGQALVEIRDDRLYRESGATFDDFCKQLFGLSRSRLYQLIDLVEIRAVVSTTVDSPAPTSERVARELTPLREQPEAMREAWAEATEKHGPEPTAAQVRDVVRGPEPPGSDTRFSTIEDANALLLLLPAADQIAWPTEPGDVAAMDEEVKRLKDTATKLDASWRLHKRDLRGMRAVR